MVSLRIDHAPLQHLEEFKHDNTRLRRWVPDLQSVRFEEHAVPGSENVVADFPCRLLGNETSFDLRRGVCHAVKLED